LSHFQIFKVLGRGSFGKVMLVEYLKTGQLYAMKVLRKDVISMRNQEIHVRAEKTILQTLSHPFLV
jgi:protein-serine/threonine kinase